MCKLLECMRLVAFGRERKRKDRRHPFRSVQHGVYWRDFSQIILQVSSYALCPRFQKWKEKRRLFLSYFASVPMAAIFIPTSCHCLWLWTNSLILEQEDCSGKYCFHIRNHPSSGLQAAGAAPEIRSLTLSALVLTSLLYLQAPPRNAYIHTFFPP